MTQLFITPAQCRMARALLNWSQPELAERCNLSVMTVSKFEKEASDYSPEAKTLMKMMENFKNAGLEFTSGEGVKRKENTIHVYEGKKGFWDFYDDIYETAKEVGGEFCVNNVSEKVFESWLQEKAEPYKKNMAELPNKIHMKIIVEEGDDFFTATKYAEYRWAKKEKFSNASFYVYGNKLAILLFEPENVFVYVINEKRIADEYRKQFGTLWEQADEPQP